MTIVNHATGEITETLTKDEARRLTDRIRLIAESLAEQIEKMSKLIDEARVGSAWLALGYRSWTEYVAAEFAGVLPKLDREPRREFVRELANRGMSTRAIAPVVGASFKTVARDIEAPVSGDTPQTSRDASPRATGSQVGTDVPAKVTESEGVEPARSLPKTPEAATAPATRPPVVGMDGKRYAAAPTPKASESDLGKFLGSDISIQDSKYLKELLTAMNKVRISEFDAERVGRIADDITAMAVDHFAQAVADWHRQFTNQRSGLRVINGGAE